ncbi:unnamed protein product [Clavelina lepadiformis]|uniref:N-terminal kinase-like protein n=1 Tax=Clavelina lepadiformis TaxID=159417 RepID=A0ABP0FVT9_CLALP
MWSFFSRDPAKGFPYEVGEKIIGLESDQSIWSLHEGKQKSNGQPVSVFMFDVTSHNETDRQTAQASVKRLKTLRHPNVLTFLDSLETDKCIYMVTERVLPLSRHLKENESNPKMIELGVAWGLHQIVKGLSFLLNTVNLIHNNVCMSSMFVDAAGEWKLGGIDYMYPASGEGSNIPPIKTLPALERYDPPEKTNSSGRPKKTTKWSADMWGLGCLIWETFNGSLPRTSSLKVIGKIPKSLVRSYCELVSANPITRPSPDKFLDNCKLHDSFMNNHFVQTNLFLEEIQIKEPHEQTTFFNDLTNHLDNFPRDYSKHKILPQLLNVFQFGNGGPAVLPPLFKLGKLLDAAEYQAQIVPCVVKLFSSTDRATRIHLLRQLPLFAEHLQPVVVNSQVFPNMITGFMDTNPAIREQSVKGMLLLAPKLSDNNLNNELMKHFARLQSRDDQGPIRTNTTVCLGKMVAYLNPATRHKVISSAFARAMKDPFPAARVAGILAMCNTIQYFNTADCATKALPALCGTTVDPDKQVRDNAFKTIKVFIEKLEKASNNPEEAAKMNETAASASTASNTPASWTGWMSTGVTSITSKLYTSKSAPAPTNAGKDEKVTSTVPTPSANSDPIKAKQEHTEPLVEDNNQQNNGDGWEDQEWNSVEKDFAEKVEDKDEDNCDGWDSSSWNNTTTKEDIEDVYNDWGGGGWEDSSFQDDDSQVEDKTTSSKDSAFTPTSSYNWSKDVKTTEDNFFGAFTAKPKKAIVQNNTKARLTKTSMTKPSAVTKPIAKEKEDGWDQDEWDTSGWGDDSTQEVLSKADKLKLEREEKRKLRQKQLQEKRAAKSASGKLGARKCD